MFGYGSLQYFSYLLISGKIFEIGDLYTFFMLNLACSYITNVIPLPGGVGGAELVFTAIYTPVIGQLVGQTLILWRVSTYYIVVFIELVIFSIATSIAKKQFAKRNLANELR